MSTTNVRITEEELEFLSKEKAVLIITPVDDTFSLSDIRLMNLKPALDVNKVLPKQARVVSYDFDTIPMADLDEEVAEGMVTNIKMLMTGHIDALNFFNLKTFDYCTMAGVESIDLEGIEMIHWVDGDLQVLIDHLVLLGTKQQPGQRFN